MFDWLDIFWFPLLFPLYYFVPLLWAFVLVTIVAIPVVNVILVIITPAVYTSGLWGTTLLNVLQMITYSDIIKEYSDILLGLAKPVDLELE